MVTTVAPSSPMFSFFHMDMHGMAQESIQHGSSIPQTLPPTTTMPIADKDLVFVHLNESTGPTQDINTRHKVRAHVMRDFQRKKHKSTKPGKSSKRSILPHVDLSLAELEPKAGEASSSGDSGSEPEMIPEEVMAMVRFPSPQIVGMLEPFNTLPMFGSPRLQLLMHHYNAVLVNTLIPVNPKDKWFNYAITDTALFHGTMVHAAMHQRLVTGGHDVAEQLELKRDTIEMVNERLEDPVLSVSDVTIGAVVCLVLLENQEGNAMLSNIHMNGLQRMVALRGGVDNLGLAGVLRRKILWADICNATISGSQPRFNMTTTGSYASTTHTSSLNNGPSSITHLGGHQPMLPPPNGSCTCSDEFCSILESLRAISSQNHLEADITGTLSDNIYLAERNLFFLLKNAQDFPSMHSQVCREIGSSCFIAAQMYLYHTLRDFPLEVPIFNLFLERLNAQLWRGELSQVWEGKEHILLWILAIGALAAVGRGPMRDRYVLGLKDVCARVGVVSLQGLIGELENVVWRDAVKDLNLVGLWNEVQCGMAFESLGFDDLDLNLEGGLEL